MSCRESPPPALMDAMGKFVERSRRNGPFAKTREDIGGWAILRTDSKAEAIRVATRFMELHPWRWPGFESESEVWLMFAPGTSS